MKILLRFASVSLIALMLTAPVSANENARAPHSPPGGWPQAGMTGTFDRGALQRGFQVYKQVCAACHSLKLLSYRDLSALGYSEAEIKSIAAEYKVTDGPNDAGEMFERAARPSDRFVPPFPNDAAARVANNGALPPDLSLIVKARAGHEDYIYSILTGFGLSVPGDEKIASGMNYNPYFPGHQIAMPPPLADGAVTYADGTAATVPQMASDVVQFLAWASEPTLEQRKRTGLMALVYIAAFIGVMWAAKRRIWRKLH